MNSSHHGAIATKYQAAVGYDYLAPNCHHAELDPRISNATITLISLLQKLKNIFIFCLGFFFCLVWMLHEENRTVSVK